MPKKNDAANTFAAMQANVRKLERLEQACELKASFRKFIPLAWPIVEPTRPMMPNWHLDAICLPYNALIETSHGPKPIGELQDYRGSVLSWDHDHNYAEFRRLIYWSKSPGKPILKIAVNSGNSIELTANHPVYVKGRGYVRADEVHVGETFVVAASQPRGVHVSGLWRPEGLGQESLPEVLGEITTQAGEFSVPALREEVSPPGIEGRDSVLWSGVLRRRQDGSGEVQVPGLRRDYLPARGTLPKVLGKVESSRAGISLPPMREEGLSYARADGYDREEVWRLLRPSMLRSVCDRTEQPRILQRTSGGYVSGCVCDGASENTGARGLLLLPMRDRGNSEGEGRHSADARYSSHRPEPEEQQDGQSCFALPEMSSEAGNSGGREEVVSAIEGPLPAPEYVYNIEVEGNHNYFANGILVHNCDHLQAVAEGHIKNLLINIGPGYAKSLIASVCFSTWLWARNPQTRILAGTYATDLTVRDNIKSRTLIESEWFQGLFVDTLPKEKQWKLVKRNEDHLQNDQTGFRIALSSSSLGTGLRSSGHIYDDVINVKDAHSEAARLAARRWIFETMSSRFDSLVSGWKVAIGQRVHEDDPYGAMLESGQYVHLCLPTEYEPDRRCVTVIGFEDPRKEAGELLFPGLFPREVAEQAKRDLGEAGWAGQHQQRPAPAGGGVWKKHWFRYWQYPGMALPPVKVSMPDGTEQSIEAIHLPDMQQRGQSWDLAFKHTRDSDFVVGQVWGRRGADRFLLDQARDRMDFPATLAAIRAVTKKHPNAIAKYVEDKANGPAVISSLRQEIQGLIEINPKGGKEARMAAVAPIIQAGNVFLPHPQIAPWVPAYIEEVCTAPFGKHDDCADSTSQILSEWLGNVSGPRGGNSGRPVSSGLSIRSDYGGGGGERSWMA